MSSGGSCSDDEGVKSYSTAEGGGTCPGSPVRDVHLQSQSIHKDSGSQSGHSSPCPQCSSTLSLRFLQTMSRPPRIVVSFGKGKSLEFLGALKHKRVF